MGNLSQQAGKTLYSWIAVEKRFRPGEKLPNEVELSAQLGVSRATLREALRALLVQGVVEVRRGRGTFVSQQVEEIGDFGFSSLEQVRVGQPCEIQLDAFPDLRFRGAVHMVVPTADRSKATVLVKVRFLDFDRRILPEMSARVAFLSRPVSTAERRPRTTIPPVALAQRNGRNLVFLVKGDRVVERAVNLGVKVGELVEVTSGVKSGESLVLRPADSLRDGSRISIPEK